MNHEHEALKSMVRAFTQGLRLFEPSSLSKPLIEAILDSEAFKQMELLAKKKEANNER